MNSNRLARLILGFWAGWYALVVASNVCDGLRALGRLGPSWHFVSGNYELVAKTIAIYGLGPRVASVLFAGVVVWQSLAALGFFVAATDRARPSRSPATFWAMAIGLGLWAAMILADELFIAFPTGIEGTHLAIFTAHLATLVAVSVMPQQTST